jgi:hypothetical protein
VRVVSTLVLPQPELDVAHPAYQKITRVPGHAADPAIVCFIVPVTASASRLPSGTSGWLCRASEDKRDVEMIAREP